MLYILNEDDTIELVEADWYQVTKIWQDEVTLDYYYNIEWDTSLFETNNPTAIWNVNIPTSKFNFAISKKLREWNTYNDFLKNITRDKIEKNVWDIYDLIADMDKRIWMIERLVMRMTDVFINKKDIETDVFMQWYKPFVEQYITLVNNWMIKGRNDLEDLSVIFSDLITKTNTISSIVENEYLNKKI